MPKIKNKLNTEELLNLVNNQWCSLEEIMKIGSLGYNNALKVKKAILKDIKSNDVVFPTGLVTMKSVVDYFKIDIDYLKKVNTKE